MNFFVGITGTLLTGGRTLVLYDIICVAICGYICFQFKKGWSGGFLPRKISMILVFILSFFVISFVNLGELIGRKETEDSIDLILSMYCGAEIKNLDDYIQWNSLFFF